MLRLAAASGTTDIIATPHASPAYPFDETRVRDAFGQLCESADLPVRLHLGCEVHLNYGNFKNLLAHCFKYTLNRGRYLLLELPDSLGAEPLTRAIRELVAAGLVPVIAHAERNRTLQQAFAVAHRWKELGCLLQITGESLLGGFGTTARRAAEQLIDSGWADIVASDAHNCTERSPDLRPAYHHVLKTYGGDIANRLFVGNPSLVLCNAEVLRIVWQKRRRLQFFHSGLSLLRSIKNAG